MAEIKGLSAIKEKWQRVTPMRSEDYKLGITSPKRDWAAQALAGKENWKTGIDSAAAKNLYAKGVEKAGSAKWKARALAKGPGRFAEGVYIAAPDYEKGFAPYHSAIAAVTLPPRFPKRDPRNLTRVKAVVDAMITEKIGK